MIPRAVSPYSIMSVQKHVSIDENAVLSTILIDGAPRPPPAKQNFISAYSKKETPPQAREKSLATKKLARNGEVAESKQCTAKDRPANLAAAANKNINARQQGESKDHECTNQNDKYPAPQRTKTKRRHSGKLLTGFNIFNNDEVDTIERDKMKHRTYADKRKKELHYTKVRIYV